MRPQMNKGRLLLLIALALCSIAWVPDIPEPKPLVPTWYHSSPCQKPVGVTFYDWLPSVRLGSYRVGKNDCSQRSAYVEWLAESCGYDARFAARYGSPAHVWLLVSVGGEWLAFETSFGSYWILEDASYYSYDLLVDDVEDWLSLYPGETKWFLSEWAWWDDPGQL